MLAVAGKLYPASFDGNTIATWVSDLCKGLVDEADLPTAIQTKSFNSKFLQAVSDTYTALGNRTDYNQFTKYFDLLKHFTAGMRSAMKYRPETEDYNRVEYHLPLYTMLKAQTWPGSLCWYDSHNFYHIPKMMRRWGSLGLVSQEGMEGWQKVLNQVLRMGNGFANAGAVPIAVKEAGPDEVQEYMDRRAETKIKAKWVYEQALLKDTAKLNDSLDAYEILKDTTVTWPYFCDQWKRYSSGTRILLKALSRFRLRKARAQGTRSTYYKDLLRMYREYWANTPDDVGLKDKFTRKKLRKARQDAWAKVMCGPPRVSNPLEQQLHTDYDAPDIAACGFHAIHPCQRSHYTWAQ